MTCLQLVLWVTSTSGIGDRSKAPAEDVAGVVVRADYLYIFSSFSSANGIKHDERQRRHANIDNTIMQWRHSKRKECDVLTLHKL